MSAVLWQFPVALALATASVAAAPLSALNETEALQPPTPARLTEYCSKARKSGWAALTPELRAVAMRAYEKNRLPAAEAWFYVYCWSALMGESDRTFLPRWIKAMEDARVVHRNMPTHFTARDQPVGFCLSPEMQAWLVSDYAFSEEFFSIISPVDFLPGVFQILNTLHQQDPGRFKAYANLALAIAVVYDVPPPPDWPHGQVSQSALPRRFPSATDAFNWWTREDRAGRTYHHLTRLDAGELKFVVDAVAPFNQLEWAQKTVNYPLGQFERVYKMIRYRNDRVINEATMWPGSDYTLAAILSAGGICVDQAYFATEAGKARGVPTLLFRGAGMDGRHAWFGFLDGNMKWQLDAGRYAEQRFVTGLAEDPQTWHAISDHELKFLSERFHALPSFRQSRVHEQFAGDYLHAGEFAAAEHAARRAVGYEPRNLQAWELLLAAEQAERREPKFIEGTLREAALAFQRYPDVETLMITRVCQSMRDRGETSAADFEERQLAWRNQEARGDLSLQQARDSLVRNFGSRSPEEQVRTYNSTVDTMGRGAGIGFFDEIVTVFVEHLLVEGRRDEALRAAERARRSLKVDPGSQLDQEFTKMLRDLRTPR